ncbi:MAG: helix-turn-helix transcriptional regulator [Acidimicrobiaceae bacterium]|nr:helix-turn-helix transcriptional regulator [Acidimicrobiaceae bacterium]
MEQSTPVPAPTESGTSRFGLAPPRRFILPAILLLLTERPGYGYALVPRLEGLSIGHIDRPAVYRALAQLERDGLVEASSQNPKAGQARRVYRVTALGERVLRVWMGVVKEEQDFLAQVLRRYQATDRGDAVLAEVEGGWAAALGAGWSPVSSTSVGHRQLLSLGSIGAERTAHDRPLPTAEDAPPWRTMSLIPDRSVVLIDVRSTVGPLSFGAIGLTGTIEAAVVAGTLLTDPAPAAHLEIDMSGLRSGNSVYDAELRRRIDARQYPKATVDLSDCMASGVENLYRVTGELTFHGVSRPADGMVRLEVSTDGRLVISGEQVFDIRDYAVPSPTVLMLRIYPDVRVRLHAEVDLGVELEEEQL